MFDSCYPYNLADRKKVNEHGDELTHFLYTFTDTKNNRYMVEVCGFPMDVFTIKFSLKQHQLSKDKYSLLSNANIPFTVLGTCLEIMLEEFYEINKNSSFAFSGAPLINEDIANTKRFRVYQQMIRNIFSPLKFNFYFDTSKSFYLMLNKKYQSDNDVLLIRKIFDRHFVIDN